VAALLGRGRCGRRAGRDRPGSGLDADLREQLEPARRERRRMNGSRPLSIRSPSVASSAGRTVSEPATATATTMIVPTANDRNTGCPTTNMPDIATITVNPEISTARPDVAAAASSAAALSRPAARSSRWRRM
jgi:hypothetical protein